MPGSKGLHSSTGLRLKWPVRFHFLTDFFRFNSVDKLEAHTLSSKGPGRATDIWSVRKKEEKMTRQSNIFQKWSLEGEMAVLHHSVLQPSHFAGQQDDKHIFKGRNGGKEEEGGQHQQSAPHIPFCQLKTSEENNLQPMAAAGVSSNGDI